MRVRKSLMEYYELSIETDDIEELSAKLAVMDITSYTIEDPATLDEMISSCREYDWDYIDPSAVERGRPRIICYFENREDAERTASALPEYKTSLRPRDDAEWKDKYKESFRTIDLTEKLMVKPSWEPVPRTDKMIIELDPGMAFGTGDHETTAMCAFLLEKEGCENKRILDVGTGTGILSIAARLLGAREALAIDIDPDAVRTARENVEKNGCSGAVKVMRGDLARGISFRADIVVANIVAELIAELAGSVTSHLEKGGYFISSGILAEKAGMVEKSLEDAGLTIEDEISKGEWTAIGARYE